MEFLSINSMGDLFLCEMYILMIYNNTNMYYILCAGQESSCLLIFPNFWSLSQSLLNNLSFHIGDFTAPLLIIKFPCTSGSVSGLCSVPFDYSYGKTKLKNLSHCEFEILGGIDLASILF